MIVVSLYFWSGLSDRWLFEFLIRLEGYQVTDTSALVAPYLSVSSHGLGL